MRIGKIEGATHEFAPPSDWNNDNGDCASLPVRLDHIGTTGVLVSAWFPTQAEITAIAAGEPIYLHVYGSKHPPVYLGVKGVEE